MAERIRWIDIARGIGILYVIINHTRLIQIPFFSFGTSFDLPLFFILSGYCFDESKYKSVKDLFFKRCKSLIYPYLTLSVVILCIFKFFAFDDGSAFLKTLHGIPHGYSFGPMWFITALFWLDIMAYFVTKMSVKTLDRLFFAFCLSIIGYNTPPITQIYNSFIPNGLNVAMFCLPFFFLGHLLKSEQEKRFVFTLPFRIITGSIALCISLILYWSNPRIFDLAIMDIGHPVIYMILGVTGTYATFVIAYFIEKVKFVSDVLIWCGKNSLALFVFHCAWGLCRNTWTGMNNILSIIMEYAAVIACVLLSAYPLRFLITPTKQRLSNTSSKQ